MDVERNLVVITPAGAGGKRASVTSTTKFEIRKSSDNSVTNVKGEAERSRGSKICFRMADVFMTMLIVFPLSITIWRGVWQIMDHYSVVWDIDPWLSIGLGYFIPFVMYCFQEPLKSHVNPREMRYVYFYIISRSLLLIHIFGGINQWRGLWAFMDLNFGKENNVSIITLVLGTFFNLLFRTFSNVLAPPLLCCVDEAFTINNCPLRFKTPVQDKWRYLLDILFSVGFIPTLTVFGWRGLWTLADMNLYPEDAFMSALTSLGFGYIICIVQCSVQPLICDFVYNLEGFVRLAVLDLCYMVGFIGCVFAWRGVWNMYNIVFAIESSTPCLSEWVTMLVGVIGMVLLGCLSTVMARGIVIDGEMDKNDAAEWLIPYISHLRRKIDNVPFPEPWLFRYLCTSQKMNSDIIRVTKRQSGSGSGEKMNILSNSVHPITISHPDEDNPQMRRPNKNPRIRLSHLPHIDSSSEEDLGEREAMVPNPDLDVFHSGSRLQEVIKKQRTGN